jgi:hypothetical protein
MASSPEISREWPVLQRSPENGQFSRVLQRKGQFSGELWRFYQVCRCSSLTLTLWSELKQHPGNYEEVPKGMLELWEWDQVVWDNLVPEYCQKLIESMPRCMAMVLERKGKSIPY